MSTPDARLSAAERAALADLEAAAAAADPYLASRLRGGNATPAFTAARVRVLRMWAAVLGAARLGPLLVVAGLLFMLVGLTGGLDASVLGTVLAVVGLRMTTELVPGRRTDRSD